MSAVTGPKARIILGAALVGGTILVTVVGLVSWRPAPVAASPPADILMSSVVADDGTLGWQQLCPGARAELPLAVLLEAVDAVRSADASTGTEVTVQLISAVPRPDGGERRVYVATARRPEIPQLQQKTFVVRTQASGCVEALE